MEPGAKPFDCVAMRVEGALRVSRRIAGMSREEELACWTRREEALAAWMEALDRGIDAPFPAEDDGPAAVDPATAP
jgi:hypothetical protein